MRILVRNLFKGEQCAGFLQILENRVVGFVVFKTGKFTGFFGLVALVINGNQNFKLIFDAGEIVIDTVAGRCMNKMCIRDRPILLRTCSKARPAANMANELANTVFPVEAIPAATDIILPSAIPQSKNRDGNAFLKIQVLVASARSASKTTKS